MTLKELEIKKQALLAELNGVEEQIKELDTIEISELPDGEKFNWCGYTWIKLGNEQGGILCITTSFITTMPFNKDNDADYKKSNIKEFLEKSFLEKLNEEDLLDYFMDLTSDNGDKALGNYISKIGLLCCDLYRKYYYQIPHFDDWWWTCTAWGFSSLAHYVRDVFTSGVLYSGLANFTYGVVPACILKPSTKIRHDRGE